MAEKVDLGEHDPGGLDGGGGGFDPGGITLTDEDAGFDQIVDGFNEHNRKDHELNDPSDTDAADPKTARKVAPPAPPVDHTAALGGKYNPIVVPKKRGAQY